MQLLVRHREVTCPVCDLVLSVEQEQDKRVAYMYHGAFMQCPYTNKLFRVDRLTGYAEEVIREKPAEVPLPPRRVPSQGPQRQGPDIDTPEAS